MADLSDRDAAYWDAHTSDGRCKYPRSCEAEGTHADRDAVAATLAAHQWQNFSECSCGFRGDDGHDLADVLAPLLAQARDEGRAEVAEKAKKYRREARKHQARAAQARAEAVAAALAPVERLAEQIEQRLTQSEDRTLRFWLLYQVRAAVAEGKEAGRG